jgi:uncharacterized membrane protein
VPVGDADSPPVSPSGAAGVPADTASPSLPPFQSPPKQDGQGDHRRFFFRGLGALLPTLITLWLLTWVWDFLWNSIGRHVIYGIRWVWLRLGEAQLLEYEPAGEIRRALNEDVFWVRLLGVGLAVLLVYLVGVLIGNLIGRTFYRMAERAVMRVPLIRAIYPAVKQVTDFVLGEKKSQLLTGKVVAVQARAQGIWSIGFVTGQGYRPLNQAISGQMLTIFIPSTPTAFSGYMVVAHREAVVELPLTVEETMRLILSGGVIVPQKPGAAVGPEPEYLGSHYRMAVLGVVAAAVAGVPEGVASAGGEANGTVEKSGPGEISGTSAVEPR